MSTMSKSSPVNDILCCLLYSDYCCELVCVGVDG
jgi:hypothetical protein